MKRSMILLFTLIAMPLMGNWDVEHRKIDYLLNQIKEVEGAFIRNGTAHPPEEAGAHLEMKMKRAINSWFAPAKEKWTAKMFIEKLASKSSLTGTPYQIRFRDGRTVNAGEWLSDRLNQFPFQIQGQSPGDPH